MVEVYARDDLDIVGQQGVDRHEGGGLRVD